jgi:hypothetical protein
MLADEIAKAEAGLSPDQIVRTVHGVFIAKKLGIKEGKKHGPYCTATLHREERVGP